MSDPADPAVNWVQRVLGFTIPPDGPGIVGAQAAPRAVAPTIAFTQSRLLWDNTRKQVQGDLRSLEATVLQETADEPDAQEIASGSAILYTVLDALDERLLDKLDEALNAQTPEERTALGTEARNIIDEYLDYMKADELLHDIDDNGFIDLKIQDTVSANLKAISGNLKALGA